MSLHLSPVVNEESALAAPTALLPSCPPMVAASQEATAASPELTPAAPPQPRGPRRGSPRRAFLLSEPETARLIDSTAGERFELRDRALLELLYGSAVRCSEALRLRVEDLDLAQGAAWVLGKGKKVRRVPLGAPAVAALRAYLAQTGLRIGWIFRNKSGRRVTNRLIRRVVEKYAAKAGVAHSSPHTLRHSAASHMLARGGYLYAVKELLGHVHVQTTAGYLHFIDPGESAEAIYRRSHPRARPARAARAPARGRNAPRESWRVAPSRADLPRARADPDDGDLRARGAGRSQARARARASAGARERRRERGEAAEREDPRAPLRRGGRCATREMRSVDRSLTAL